MSSEYLQGGDVSTIASDRGANVMKALRLLSVPQQPCDGHVLGVAVHDALGLKFSRRGNKQVSSNPAAYVLLKKVMAINKYLAFSTAYKVYVASELEDGANAMVAHHSIRWRSTRDMCLRQAELAEEIQKFAQEAEAKRNFAKKKPDDDWRAFVTQVSAVLTGADAFYGATRLEQDGAVGFGGHRVHRQRRIVAQRQCLCLESATSFRVVQGRDRNCSRHFFGCTVTFHDALML